MVFFNKKYDRKRIFNLITNLFTITFYTERQKIFGLNLITFIDQSINLQTPRTVIISCCNSIYIAIKKNNRNLDDPLTTCVHYYNAKYAIPEKWLATWTIIMSNTINVYVSAESYLLIIVPSIARPNGPHRK